MKQREKIIPYAHGNVLEIGIGSGLNINFYDSAKVKHLYGLDPSEEMWSNVQHQLKQPGFPIEFLPGYAEKIPLGNKCIDSIVVTYTLCSIPELESTFSEMRRVLKPTGSLVFCEHGAASDKSVEKWQNRLNPIWKRLGGGCNLNRRIPELIQSGGFNISNIDSMYIPGYKPVSFNYWGVAKPN